MRLLPLSLPLVDAAIESDDALAEASGLAVTPGWATFTGALAYVRDQLRTTAVDLRWGSQLFVDGDPEAIVGWGGFKGAPVDGTVEIGYEIAESCRGRGLATAAAELMLTEAFREPAVGAVMAHTLAESNASNHILGKLGLRHDGEFVAGDEAVWRYSIERQEYLARSA